ncbi:SH2 domain [Phytophthora infestans]|uniref:SH2 domain n=1 Tax=Phytophthora infestans TaxID=4787 RepID=A0A833WY09_PHYIN|nr:SH2 domain [Phytophthora infestans]
MASSRPAETADSATSKWMKMISSTFLGEGTSSSLFGRRSSGTTGGSGTGVSQESLGRWAKLRAENGLDPTPELKIALVGGSAVGKTSIVRRWLQRSYPTTYSPTVGVEVNTMAYKHRGQELLLQLWDVSSAEVDVSASSLHSLLCEDLDGIFFVFNVHRVSSIAAIDKWRHCLSKYLSPKETPCFLISHKADLLQKRVMTSDDIAAYARAAGYKGWMWTVGKANFGENEKNPPVREALERMVEFICRDRIATEHIQLSRLARPLGILETSGNPAPLEIIQTDDALHHFSTSLLRIPTKAITTLPRDENMMPINEELTREDNEEKKQDEQVSAALRTGKRAAYGGSWILGNDKGVYLRATNSSLLGNDETDDDAESVEEFQFPFSSARQLHEEEDAAAAAESRRREKEEEDLERRREEEKAERDRRNDQEAWHFFAGSISRAHAEALLENREQGTFLLRRKDAQTLVLSYLGPDHVHHVLIEFSNRRYHIGSSKASQATSFTTLWKCLRSVRRYAYRGLVFSRNMDFSVVNKQQLVVEDGSIASGSATDATTPTAAPTTPSIWRTRTRSGSNSSSGDRSNSSRHASPTTAPRRARHTSGLQANQEQVRIPPQTRIDELSVEFYEHLAQRLSYLAAQQKTETPEGDGDNKSGLAENIAPLLEMVAQEKSEQRQVRGNNAETQWRQLVKNMEAWNRIVMNLELSTLQMA